MSLSGRVFRSFAPGRLDVMGGIADYSGSLVLQMAIHEKTEVTVTLHDEGVVRLTSDNNGNNQLSVEIPLKDILHDGEVDYAFANDYFRKNYDMLWAGYVVGCALVLRREKGCSFTGGDFKISSNVPIGKGVSSSASLEVATMKALADAMQIAFVGTELPMLAQKVENLVVGAPCGLMDQLTTYFGEPDKLLPIICQPDNVLEKISVDPKLRFVGIDSGIRHSVGGASYGDVRCAAFMGYTMIAHTLGVDSRSVEETRKTGARSQLPYHGYLCNISVTEFESRFQSLLPEEISGGEFIQRFGTTIDGLSIIQPHKRYQILACTSHPIYENQRVHEFKSILQNRPVTVADSIALGKLMFKSHESYSRCGLGSDRTDIIVSRAKEFLQDGIYGAKITGGGSGGTVCLLVDSDAGLNRARTIHKELSAEFRDNLVFLE